MRGGARKGQVDREIGRGWGKRVRYRQSGEEGKMRKEEKPLHRKSAVTTKNRIRAAFP